MKKISVALFAVVLAILFSAFTPAPAPFTTVYFLDDNDLWRNQDLVPCTAGSNPVCIKTTTSYGDRRIFQSQSESDPFTSNQP